MKTFRVATIVLTMLALLFGVSVLTAAAAGVANTSPTSAPYIDNQTHSIPANSSLWYRFDYAGDRSQIMLTLANGNDNGLAFNVFTPAQIGDWWETAPIGRSNGQGDNLVWTGDFNAGGTYYVEVTNNTGSALAAPLNIQGSGVTLALVGAPQASNIGGAAAPAPQAPSTSAAPSAGPVANTDPGHAIMIDSKSHTLAANSSLWYRFNYAGDRSQIVITLPNGSASGLQFNVWTPAQAGDWWDLNPVGRGSAQAINCNTGEIQENGGCQSNDLIWTGNFNANGMYYVQVTNTTANPVSAALMVQGSGVTLGQ